MNKRAAIPFFALLLASTASGAIITEATRTYGLNSTLGDFTNPPTIFQQTISDSAILSLTEVRVGLRLSGVTPGAGFASEMFVSLNRNFAFTSILLNGAGISASDPVGFSYDGWNVTFQDNAPSGDVHWAFLSSGVLQGSWAPDGRADGTSATRAQLLNVFNAQSANGEWRLAVGDFAEGGQMKITEWSLTFTGNTVAVPEIPYPLPIYGLLALVAWRHCRQKH